MDTLPYTMPETVDSGFLVEETHSYHINYIIYSLLTPLLNPIHLSGANFAKPSDRTNSTCCRQISKSRPPRSCRPKFWPRERQPWLVPGSSRYLKVLAKTNRDFLRPTRMMGYTHNKSQWVSLGR